ncbi:MAG: TolC family protein [Paramuribaculum sp.]|nr:TolC family protein [Paramuribaculum sp.]MDE7449537.1 TolC family protein [Paramuribaculum sp.]
MKLKSSVIVAALSITMLSSCNIYRKYDVARDSGLGKEYREALEAPVDSTAFGNQSWEQVFTDPILADLIRQALANNVNLDNARLNVEVAHASLKGARLSYFPSVALAPSGTLGKVGSSDWSKTYQLPLAVSWEVDIFGKLLNSKRSADANYKATICYEQAVRSQIIAGVANCYYAIATLEKQLELNRQTAELWRQSVDVMRNLKEAGRLNEAAVVQSNAQYYSILASITDLEVSLHELNNTMSLLLNVAPQTWAINKEAKLQAPSIMRDAIPMRELAARPDIRAAEQTLAAAYYTTAGARANFYPGLNITANGGFTNLLGSMVKNPGEFFINIAGSLTVPIFSRGANIARLEAAKAQQKQALNNFEYAILNASAEVSSAMTVYQKAEEKEQYLIQQVDNLSKSVEYTGELLTLGTATYLEVLTAQQGLLGAQMGLLSCSLSQAQAVINLYQNLGGGR